jgi:hypothetical protein
MQLAYAYRARVEMNGELRSDSVAGCDKSIMLAECVDIF